MTQVCQPLDDDLLQGAEEETDPLFTIILSFDDCGLAALVVQHLGTRFVPEDYQRAKKTVEPFRDDK
jgi:hypothetical protein